VLYATGNHVFRTTDEGASWQVISPDLTRRNPETLKASGGPLTLDTSGAEHYGTVFAFAESPLEQGVLWAGSDDGLLHISRDNGGTWTDITPSELPDDALMSLIEPSWHAAGTAYVAATRYKLDDYRPYLLRTTDYGQTWQRIDGALPQNEITRVVREDTVQPGLLYVGTETGLFVSLDDGERWLHWQGNLPVAPIYDMKIKECDLVIATHGRSFWIMDDLSPLREYASGLDLDEPQLLPPQLTVRHYDNFFVGAFGPAPDKNYMIHLGAGQVTYRQTTDEYGELERTILDGGQNPPNGVIIYYTLPDGVDEEDAVSLTINDVSGNEIRTFASKTERPTDSERALSVRPGLNRFVWDLRYPDAPAAAGDLTVAKTKTGPRAAPGIYQVALRVGDSVQTQSFELKVDPRLNVGQAELNAQFALWRQISDKVAEVHAAATRLQAARAQVQEWVARAGKTESGEEVVAAGEALIVKLDALEAELIQTEARTAGDRLRLKARLNQKLISLISVVAAADARPPRQAYDVFDSLAGQADTLIAELDKVLGAELNAFVDLLQRGQIPLIVPDA
jgi:hypothetical protein